MKNGKSIGVSVTASLSLLVFLSGSTSFGKNRLEGPPAETEADLVIINAKVITVDKDFSVAEAVALKDGKIVAVGTRSAVEKSIGKKAKSLDLQGKTLLPGMNDTHLHFQWLATKKPSPVLAMGGPGPKTTREQDKQALIATMRGLNARGITSITDPGLNEEYVGMYRELYKEGKLTIRTNVLWCFSQRVENDLQKIRAGLDAAGTFSGRDNSWLNVLGLKLGADNLPNDKSAWMREDYMTSGNGRLYYPGKTNEERAEAMRGLILYAHKLGYQVGVHATGDRAIKTLVETYAEAEESDPKGLRHYIIHGDFTPIDSDLVRLMVKHNIGVSAQPGLAMMVGHSMGINIKPEIMAGFAPLKTLIAAGVHVAGGSDGPIIDPDWKQGIQSAMTRKAGPEASFFGSPIPDEQLNPDQGLTLKEAIRMYTIEGAWLDGMEKIKGSIEAGKLADFCVLDQDIMTVDADKIKDIPTVLTMVDGKIVYNAKPDVFKIR